jgi:hypothetical protein
MDDIIILTSILAYKYPNIFFQNVAWKYTCEIRLDQSRFNQNMLNFPWIDGMTLPFPLAKVHNS